MIFNLINNAINAAPVDSEIKVFVQYQSVDHLRAKIKIDVQDSGPGYDREQRAKLFQPPQAAVSGLQGLHLHLSQLVARKLGGSVEMSNVEPPGSMFSFSFEIQKPIFDYDRKHVQGNPIRPIANRRRASSQMRVDLV